MQTKVKYALKLTCVLPSATTNFVSLVSACYMFHSHWLSSGLIYMILKLKIKCPSMVSVTETCSIYWQDN